MGPRSELTKVVLRMNRS